MGKLFDIAERYKNIEELSELVNSGELDAEVLQNALNEVEGELTDKLNNITYIVRKLEGEMATIKAEKERLDKREKTTKKTVENLKSYMFNAMKFTDTKKLSNGLNTWTIAKSPKSVLITDEKAIREEFKTEKVTIAVDKKKIKEAIENGEIIDGAELIQNESLRIK